MNKVVIIAYIICTQGRRKYFRIGQAIKNFLLAPLTNFLSTITTCKDSLCLADASWFLKLMVAISCKSKIVSALIHPFGL